jgi:hypothetical protein
MRREGIIATARIAMFASCLLAAGAGPATAPATQPATENSPPKIALREFVRAVFAGDEKAYLFILFFSGDDARNSAQALLSQVVSRRKLQGAARDLFRERAREFAFGMTEEDLADTEKSLNAAAAIVEGDQARITFVEGPVYFLVKKDGHWLLDFSKTQSGMGRLMPAAQIEIVKRQTAAIDQLTRDALAHKFTSPEELRSQLDRIDNMFAREAPATSPAHPATRP